MTLSGASLHASPLGRRTQPWLSPASESSHPLRFRATQAATTDRDADCESCVAPDSPNLSIDNIHTLQPRQMLSQNIPLESSRRVSPWVCSSAESAFGDSPAFAATFTSCPATGFMAFFLGGSSSSRSASRFAFFAEAWLLPFGVSALIALSVFRGVAGGFARLRCADGGLALFCGREGSFSGAAFPTRGVRCALTGAELKSSSSLQTPSRKRNKADHLIKKKLHRKKIITVR